MASTVLRQRYDLATLERMLFRRGFVLAPRHIGRFGSWQRVDIDGGLTLTAHPDLGVQHAAKDGKSITLLGYALDPLRPSASDLEVIEELLDGMKASEDLFESTARLGGRWTLIANDGRRTLLFTDAVGMRQAFYTHRSSAEGLWCASQPGLLAELLKLPLDPEAVAFTKSKRYVENERHANTWYPGSSTPYDCVRLLLPNHYLDLHTGRSSRYWPTSNLPTVSLDDAVAHSLATLQGLMESARARFKMSIAMTAGWDSRLVLAATRSMARDLFCFTGVFWNMTEDHPDAAIPSRLLAKIGLKNHLLPCCGEVDPEFGRVFMRNVVMGHAAYASVAQGLFDGCPPDLVCIKGDVAEIVKCYWRPALGRPVRAHDLAELAEMDAHPFAIRAFEEWLRDARTFNVHLLDLFCWEQAMGRLEAMVEAECDIAQENFSPLNCRALLTTMLSVPERYRQAPNFRLFRELIERMWPEVLSEPINGQAQTGARAFLRRKIADTGLQKLVPARIRNLGRQWLS